MPALTCALINNMPDGAFVSSERQFLGLLDAGLPPGATLEVHRHTLPRRGRSARVAGHIATSYLPLERLPVEAPDVVIVTGAEPSTPELDAEPYWDQLVTVVEWALTNSRSVLLSCLAAHVALLAFDGIHRRPLPAKLTGVYDHAVRSDHPFATDVVAPFAMPHSRLNDVAVETVVQSGYDVVVASEETGWGVITRRRGACLAVLVQGHPEYDATSLLKEYRRDVERYGLGIQSDVPCLPERCVAPEDRPALAAFHRRVLSEPPDPTLLGEFPFGPAARRAPWSWREPAAKLYTNWLAELCQPSR